MGKSSCLWTNVAFSSYFKFFCEKQKLLSYQSLLFIFISSSAIQGNKPVSKSPANQYTWKIDNSNETEKQAAWCSGWWVVFAYAGYAEMPKQGGWVRGGGVVRWVANMYSPFQGMVRESRRGRDWLPWNKSSEFIRWISSHKTTSSHAFRGSEDCYSNGVLLMRRRG